MRLPAQPRRPARIEMIPLVDLIFLLLVSFTYAQLEMIEPRGLTVRLPRAGGVADDAREPIAVTIGRRGELFVDREPVVAGALVTRVRERLAGADDGWVMVNGDAEASLEAALGVLGLLRDGGIERVTFRTRPPNAGGDGP